MEPTRKIYNCDWVTEFLQYILDTTTEPVSLIICSTRDSFLVNLAFTIQTQPKHTSNGQELLKDTIGLLANSTRAKLIFCPTLEHLRAYIGVLRPTSDGNAQHGTTAGQNKRPLVAILNCLALHLPTSEFSAQGLSRTLAAAVEVTSRNGMDLVLCECRDAANPADPMRGEALWFAQVPLLNSAVRTGGDDAAGGGLSVPVKRIAQRWFEFSGMSCPETDTRTS
ncbi:hypothetical protein P168DRAFT_327724 [Aspergillus campestris IBT 28561]|uniref:Uncharacterized protein n=1 Tax=Aspergillus campestris (strain IBT 28561) TaxID=1392248 RepID=A0A2I1D1D6_ASPC2|nr:uncharacterized protein P168DRAFT_327724 [Aspergillus campestris IBT 28561]PKY03668.1 hypothetical protein P168DRAFT_327724 [Aspergillus campestris IBT 28561]